SLGIEHTSDSHSCLLSATPTWSIPPQCTLLVGVMQEGMTVMRRTATTAHAILGLLALRPAWPTYALTQQLRRNMRFFWPRVESRIYDEAKHLVTRGLAQARSETVGQRTRTVYAITPAGRQALERWLATPPRATTLECEPLLRVFCADFCT